MKRQVKGRQISIWADQENFQSLSQKHAKRRFSRSVMSVITTLTCLSMRLNAFSSIRLLVESFSETCFTSYNKYIWACAFMFLRTQESLNMVISEALSKQHTTSWNEETSTDSIVLSLCLCFWRAAKIRKKPYLTFEAVIYDGKDQVGDKVNPQ